MTAPLPAAPDLKAATARILRGSGEATAGTGLLLVGGLLATCAHVVRRALDLPKSATPPPDALVRLHFPQAGAPAQPQPVYQARVAAAGWRPEADVAILELASEPPFFAGWDRGRDPDNEEARAVDCFGYGESTGEFGATAELRLPTNAVRGHEADLLRRDPDSALAIEDGYSGGPVYDPERWRVFGLMRTRGTLQGRQVAGMIVYSAVNEAYLAAWTARRTRQAPTDTADLAPLFAAARDAVEELRRITNARRLTDGLADRLEGLKESLAESDAIDESAYCLRDLALLLDEARRADLDRHLPRLALGNLPLLLAGLVKAAPPPNGTHEVDNDWDTNEALPHASLVLDLLNRIVERRSWLATRPPGLVEATRRALRTQLSRLEGALYRNPLSLAEIDAVRAELERLDRDALSALICACQVLLGRHAAHLPPLAVFRDRPNTPEMVVIPAGEFRMGSFEDEEGHQRCEAPLHRVRIDRPFALGRKPVTFEEYDRFCYATGQEKPDDEDWGRDRRPVINVSWREARAYLYWLSQQVDADYRLPSEAEWEYTCRADTTSRWCFGDDGGRLADHAWFDENSGWRTRPAGEMQANAWGLYDMHGNVWEWCSDDWHANYEGAPADGTVWRALESSPLEEVLRGGSWSTDAAHSRAACRHSDIPGTPGFDIGFRCARVL